MNSRYRGYEGERGIVVARMLRYTFIGLSVLASLAPVAVSAGEPRGTFSEQRVHFARGAHGATLRGQVSRDEALLYIVGAKAGQSMTVKLDGDAKTSFDLSGPKASSGQAMASGETEWAGKLPDDGDYKIFVFTEDRVEAPFTLEITIEK
jgi:hypothetical protein